MLSNFLGLPDYYRKFVQRFANIFATSDNPYKEECSMNGHKHARTHSTY